MQRKIDETLTGAGGRLTEHASASGAAAGVKQFTLDLTSVGSDSPPFSMELGMKNGVHDVSIDDEIDEFQHVLEDTRIDTHAHDSSEHSDVPHTSMKKALNFMQRYSIPLQTGIILALLSANFADRPYHELFHTDVVKGFEILGHPVNLHFLINDVFMALFFGIAAKEITESCLPGGALNPPLKAINPLLATLGGVLGPVAVYMLIAFVLFENGAFGQGPTLASCGATTAEAAGDMHRRILEGVSSSEESRLVDEYCAHYRRLGAVSTNTSASAYAQHNASHAASDALVDYAWSTIQHGWGIPTATDIAFAWMVAGIIWGPAHPAVGYLLLLAVADDGLGLIIIAIFYPNQHHPFVGWWLLSVLAGMLISLGLRKSGCMKWHPYILLGGIPCWLGLLGAGLHPALSLVFVVPFLPDHAPVEPNIELGLTPASPRARAAARVPSFSKSSIPDVEITPLSKEEHDLIKTKDKETHDTIVDALRECPLFEHMPDEAIEKMVDATVRAEFNSHDMIVREGSADDDLYIVYKGGATLSTKIHGETFNKDYHHGDYFGEYAFLQHARRTATITAHANTVCFKINSHCVDHMDEDSKHTFAAMRTAFTKVMESEAEMEAGYHNAPLHNFEHDMKLFVDFGLLFFAWANAGVKLETFGTMTTSIFLALTIGKVLGICGMAILADKFVAPLPAGVGYRDLVAVSICAAIGLTVALFVSGEAYGGSCTTYGLEKDAKLGALLSTVAGPLAIAVGRFLEIGTASKEYKNMRQTQALQKSMAAKGLDLNSAFDQFDTDGDGVLSADEFRRGLASMGCADTMINDLTELHMGRTMEVDKHSFLVEFERVRQAMSEQSLGLTDVLTKVLLLDRRREELKESAMDESAKAAALHAGMVDADELHAAQDELASARQTIKALHEMLQAHGVGVNFPELNYVLSPTVQRVIVEDEQSETPILTWLDSIGAGEYARAFQDQGFETAEDLWSEDISDDDLAQIGVKKLRARKMIVRIIRSK